MLALAGALFVGLRLSVSARILLLLTVPVIFRWISQSAALRMVEDHSDHGIYDNSS